MTTKSNLEKIAKELGVDRVKYDEPLSEHTYFKIGGPADLFYLAKTADQLIQAVQASIRHQVPYFVLGGGSNILVGDKGFRGLVIKNRADAVRTIGFQGKVSQKRTKISSALVEAETGSMVSKLVRFSIEEGLSGLEVFLTVPGTVGGAIYNNSHYRPEKDEFFGNFLHSALILDKNGKKKQVDQRYFNFSYDYSNLHKTHNTVIKATFSLTGGNKDEIWKRATRLIKRRNQRQPIGIACSGCTFKNISKADAFRLGTPNHTQSTGYLIDKAGLKGETVGKLRISDVHASFIENTDGATAKDALKLIDKIKDKVFTKFGVKLELEIFLVGEF